MCLAAHHHAKHAHIATESKAGTTSTRCYNKVAQGSVGHLYASTAGWQALGLLLERDRGREHWTSGALPMARGCVYMRVHAAELRPCDRLVNSADL